MDKYIFELMNKFAIKGTPVRCAPCGEGHINKTFLVETDTEEKYILQRINNHVFKNVDELMKNISSISEFLSNDDNDLIRIPMLYKTKAGENYVHHDDDTYWRLTDYIDGICFQVSERPDDFYKAALAFGRFQQTLAKFPAETLYETIPDFHNTVDRYRKFHEIVDADRCGRNASAQPEIEFVLERESIADSLMSQLEAGLLPLRVTHNDTKLNNVLFDKETRDPIAILDLDTVMPGLSVCDFGDAVRFGASTAREDEQDLSKVEFDLNLFESFTKGYFEACPDLTRQEKLMMPMGAKIIALELGSRFLGDYLDGDRYFAIARESHNLDRARTQLKLAADMEKKWDEMNAIIAEYM